MDDDRAYFTVLQEYRNIKGVSILYHFIEHYVINFKEPIQEPRTLDFPYAFVNKKTW